VQRNRSVNGVMGWPKLVLHYGRREKTKEGGKKWGKETNSREFKGSWSLDMATSGSRAKYERLQK